MNPFPTPAAERPSRWGVRWGHRLLCLVCTAVVIVAAPDDLASDSRSEVLELYQQAVDARTNGDLGIAEERLKRARSFLPDVEIDLTRALLTEFSLQLGARGRQSELWEAYELSIEHHREQGDASHEELLFLQADFGAELVRKKRFARGKRVLLDWLQIVENRNDSGAPLDPAVVHHVLAHLGMAAIKSGEPGEGIAYLERALMHSPELVQSWERWLMAETYVRLRKYEKALPLFSLLDPFMQSTYTFHDPARVKFRELYSRALKKVGNETYAARILGRYPRLNYRRLPGDPDQVVALGGEEGYEAPVLLEKRHPAYPEAARIDRLNGLVEARLLVAANGRVVDVVLRSCEPGGIGFEAAALESLYHWVYRPASLNGTPVATEFPVSMTWSIH